LLHNDGYLPVIKKQLDHNHIDYKIIGYREKWKGWLWRTSLILECLRTNHQPDDLIVLFDGFDTIFTGKKEQLLSKYHSFNTDVVFGIEMNDSHQSSCAIKYLYFPIIRKLFGSNDKYMLNGCSFMGSAQSLIKIYERIQNYCRETGATDDQYALNNISLQGIDY
jgi:hypothetical protein